MAIDVVEVPPNSASIARQFWVPFDRDGGPNVDKMVDSLVEATSVVDVSRSAACKIIGLASALKEQLCKKTSVQ